MPVVTVLDVQNELAVVTISATSKPSTSQVEGFIRDIEAQVRGLLSGCGATWPSDPEGDAATFLRRTVLEGVRYLTLRAKYALTSSDGIPDEVQMARDAWNDAKKDICKVAAGVQNATPVEERGAYGPGVGGSINGPALAGSLFDYTLQRHSDSEREQRGGLYQRW